MRRKERERDRLGTKDAGQSGVAAWRGAWFITWRNLHILLIFSITKMSVWVLNIDYDSAFCAESNGLSSLWVYSVILIFVIYSITNRPVQTMRHRVLNRPTFLSTASKDSSIKIARQENRLKSPPCGHLPLPDHFIIFPTVICEIIIYFAN